MADTAEQNTRWIEVWISNDHDHYGEALEIAERGDAGELETFIRRVLDNAPVESPAWYTAREMRHSDMLTVDWQEVVNTLTAK